MNPLSLKKVTVIALLFVLLFAAVNRYNYFLLATYNEFFVKEIYETPKPGAPFIIRDETDTAFKLLRRILDKAFPEYKTVYDKEAPNPHLIITGYYGQPAGPIEQQKIKAPYFSVSIENKSLRWRRMRATGYPFAEFVTLKKQKEGFIFLPFFAWAYGDSLLSLFQNVAERKKTAEVRPYHVAYVYGDCTKEREGLFHALKKRLGSEKVIGMGRCSTTPGFKVPGGYGDLDHAYKKFNFVLAVENRNHKGYVTEKIINAFRAGAIPIYWGDAETVKEYFNKDAIIDATSYDSFEDVADVVEHLIKNPEMLKAKLRAPLFKGNKIPPMLLINEDRPPKEAEEIMNQKAKKFRTLYESYIVSKKNRKAFTKAITWSWDALS